MNTFLILFGASTIGALIAAIPCVLILRRLGFSAGWAVLLLVLVAISPTMSGLITYVVVVVPAARNLINPGSIGANLTVLKLLEWLPVLLLLWYFALRSRPKAAL